MNFEKPYILFDLFSNLSSELLMNFRESDKGEVRAEARAAKARYWSERGNCTRGYSSCTNSSMGTPYALAIFVTVGM